MTARNGRRNMKRRRAGPYFQSVTRPLTFRTHLIPPFL